MVGTDSQICRSPYDGKFPKYARQRLPGLYTCRQNMTRISNMQAINGYDSAKTQQTKTTDLKTAKTQQTKTTNLRPTHLGSQLIFERHIWGFIHLRPKYPNDRFVCQSWHDFKCAGRRWPGPQIAGRKNFGATGLFGAQGWGGLDLLTCS